MSNSKDPAPIKKSLKTVDRKLVISNSSKLKPPLNVNKTPKARQAISAGSLKKREPSKKHLKNKTETSNRSWRIITETTYIVKPRK